MAVNYMQMVGIAAFFLLERVNEDWISRYSSHQCIIKTFQDCVLVTKAPRATEIRKCILFSLPDHLKVIPAVCTCTSSVPSPLSYMPIEMEDRASKGYNLALFQDAGNFGFSHITLTVEPSTKIFSLLTAVGAWHGDVFCLSRVL